MLINNKISGFSLVEMLIAIILGTLILNLMLVNFARIKLHALNIRDDLNLSLESLYIIDTIKNSVSKAGFSPCGNLSRINNSLKSVYIEDNLLKIARMDDNFVRLVEINNNELITSAEFNTDKPLIIADCYHAEIKKNYIITKNKIILASNLQYNYSYPTYVGQWLEEKYFIKNNKLYYQLYDSEVLSEAVDSMNILPEHDLLHISLGLIKDKFINFDVAIRTK